MGGKVRARTKRRQEIRSVDRALDRAGANARLEKVRLAMRDPVFMIQMHSAVAWAELPQFGGRVLKPLSHVNQLRDLALGVLASLGCETAGINIKIATQPGGRVEMRAAHTPDVATEAIASARQRAS